MDILFTFVAIGVLILMMMKKVNTQMAMLAIGVVIFAALAIITGESCMGATSSGSLFVDLFEYIKGKFTSAFTGLGQTIIPIVAYSTYMNFLGASNLLVEKAIKPFKNVKNPYVMCVVVTILGAVLKMVLPSQVGLMALLFVTAYPILIGLGMSKMSAGATCLLGTAFDWGPACPTSTLIVEAGTGGSVSQFFFDATLKVFPFAIIVAAILSMIMNKVYDKKSGYVLGTDKVEAPEGEKKNIPGFYALLPILPLAVVLVFSEAVLKSITITPFAAVMLCFFFVLILETIRQKSMVKSFADTMVLFKAMGEAFGSFITLVACATVFSGALTAIGGIQKMSNALLSLSVPGILLVVFLCIIGVLLTICMATSVPSVGVVGPFISGVAEAAGVSAEQVMVPLLAAEGFSRSLTPISSIMLFVAKFMEVDIMDLIKRNLIPFLGSYIVALVASLILL